MTLQINTLDTTLHDTSVNLKYNFFDALSSAGAGSVDVIFTVTFTNTRPCESNNYILTKLSNITEQIINDGGSLVADGHPEFSYGGPFPSCGLQAKLYLLVNLAWVL